MFLQRVDNVFDLEWAQGVPYSAVRLREEVEQSKYAFNQETGIDLATYAAFHRKQFDEVYGFGGAAAGGRPAAAGARALPEVLAPVQPAGLERRVGVTERTAYILRVRQLAVAICQRYADGMRGRRGGRGEP